MEAPEKLYVIFDKKDYRIVGAKKYIADCEMEVVIAKTLSGLKEFEIVEYTRQLKPRRGHAGGEKNG